MKSTASEPGLSVSCKHFIHLIYVSLLFCVYHDEEKEILTIVWTDEVKSGQQSVRSNFFTLNRFYFRRNQDNDCSARKTDRDKEIIFI